MTAGKRSFTDKLGDISTPEGQMGRIALSRAGAEFSSAVGGIGGLLLSESLLRAPLDPVRHLVAKLIVKPHLKEFKRIAEQLPSLYTNEDKAQIEHMSDDKAAWEFSKALVDNGTAFAGSALGQMGGQMFFDKIASVPAASAKQHALIFVADKSIQIGAFFLMNTALSRPSVDAQYGVAAVLHKTLGMDRQQANEVSSYLINWQIPNVLGAAGAVAAHYNFSKAHTWK